MSESKTETKKAAAAEKATKATTKKDAVAKSREDARWALRFKGRDGQRVVFDRRELAKSHPFCFEDGDAAKPLCLSGSGQRVVRPQAAAFWSGGDAKLLSLALRCQTGDATDEEAAWWSKVRSHPLLPHTKVVGALV